MSLRVKCLTVLQVSGTQQAMGMFVIEMGSIVPDAEECHSVEDWLNEHDERPIVNFSWDL